MRLAIKERNYGYVLIMPALIFLAFIFGYPIVYSTVFCFYEYTRGLGGAEFVGLSNFRRLFLEDTVFWMVLGNTAVYTVVAVSLEFLIGLELALLINKVATRTTQKVVTTIMIIPILMAPITVGFMWRFLLQEEYGWINFFLNLVKLPSVGWYENPETSLLSLIIVDVWEWTPFFVLILTAGLANLPREPYEAATIDGASSWQLFIHFTLPFLVPVIAVGFIFRMVGCLRALDVQWVMTHGGPGNSSELITSYIWKSVWLEMKVGYASVMGFILLNLTALTASQFFQRISVD